MNGMQLPILNLFTTWRDLLRQLTAREIKARYKQSILGYAWVLIVPLVRLIVMSIVFSMFFRIKTDPIPYPLFLFAALVPWTFVSSGISAATGSLVANGSLITKIKLPREIFPTAAILVKGVDFLLSFCDGTTDDLLPVSAAYNHAGAAGDYGNSVSASVGSVIFSVSDQCVLPGCRKLAGSVFDGVDVSDSHYLSSGIYPGTVSAAV
jgi:hypothetical protein